MVGGPEQLRRLVEKMTALYEWIDSQQRHGADRAGRCKGCGECCDFDAYDHRLFVTPPELVYAAAKLSTAALKPMPGGRCPYQQGKDCTIHEHRFAGCRIFCCSGDTDFQSELSEASLKRLKAICDEFHLPYRYQDLAKALNGLATDTCRSAGAPCPVDRED